MRIFLVTIFLLIPRLAFATEPEVTGKTLEAKAKKVLVSILKAAGEPRAEVSSVARSYKGQAQAMIDSIKALKKGGQDWYKTMIERYGPAGDKVVEVYKANETKSNVLELMTAEVKKQVEAVRALPYNDPQYRQMQHVQSDDTIVFDIAPSSISDHGKFIAAVKANSDVLQDRFFYPSHPTHKDTSFHLEIQR